MPRHVVVDVETAQSYDHIVEIAAVEIIANSLTHHRFVRRVKPRSTSRVKPRSTINPFCYSVHRISLDDVKHERYFDQVLPELIDFVGGDIIVAHNSAYEYNTLKREFERASRPAYPRERFSCTMALAKRHGLPGRLRSACSHAGIRVDHLGEEHDALNDALLAAHLFIKLNS